MRLSLPCLLSLNGIVFFLHHQVEGSCAVWNFCNGHGKCGASNVCICDPGWGSNTDVSLYKAPDCSARSCPAGMAWGGMATASDTARTPIECSGNGLCNRNTGRCECRSGFTGKACDRRKCPNDCSGHGICKSMRRLAGTSQAQPLGNNTLYETRDATWDADVLYGCVCDSSWPVGLGAGQVQQPEWFGPDCSMRHCPSGDNPRTPRNELDCYNRTTVNGPDLGEFGNLCQVDCSDAGICDYSTGTCKCFSGNYGPNCGSIDGITAPDNYDIPMPVVEESTDDYYL